MHQICIKYAKNRPLHRLQHFNIANMQIICRKYASNMLNMQQKYAKNMQKICRICISLCICIFCIYMHSHFADVNTELLCTCAQQEVGAGIGTETQCMIVIIVRCNSLLALVLGSRTLSNSLSLSRGFILPAFDITVVGPTSTIHLKT